MSFVDYELLKMNIPQHSLYWLTDGFMAKLSLPAKLVETYCTALAEQGFGGMNSQLVKERLDCIHIVDAMTYLAIAAEVSFDPSSWPVFVERVNDIPSWYRGLLEKLENTELFVNTGMGARIKDWLLGVG